VGLDVESVSDEKGVARTFVVSRSGDSLRIRIGDADREVEGVQQYRIRYRVRRAVLFFPEHDELYWNATGTEWPVPIDRALAVVFPPEGGTPAEVRLDCYTRPRGAEARASDPAATDRAVRFETSGPRHPVD